MGTGINPAFMQLVLGLKGLKESAREREMRERQFTAQQEHQGNVFEAQKAQWNVQNKAQSAALTEQIREYDKTHEGDQFGKALMEYQKATPEQIPGLNAYYAGTLGKINPGAFAAMASIGGNTPQALNQQAMSPEQIQQARVEGGFRQMAGMGQGQVGDSQLRGMMAQGAMQQLQGGQQPPPNPFSAMAQPPQGGFTGMIQGMPMQRAPGVGAGMPQQAPPSTPAQTMFENYARATAQMPATENLAVAQFNASTGRQSVEVNDRQREDAYKMFLAQYNLKGTLAKNPQTYSSSDVVSLMRGAAELLNDMKDPKTSKEDNMARQQLYNQVMQQLRTVPGIAGTGTFNVPGGQQNMPSVGDPNSFGGTAWQRMSGVGSPYPFAPTPPPTYNYQTPPRQP